MKITSITEQARNKDRVNISVDGKYRFSLDLYQLVELKIKNGNEYSESELAVLEQESVFGKLYAKALEYCLIRPRSGREVRDYLYRKSRPTRDKTGKIWPGINSELSGRVFDRLMEKQYIDDVKFAHYWVENRSVAKGISKRKLIAELCAKGIDRNTINNELDSTDRSDESEIKKIIIKKRSHYPDDNKMIAYLARLGFDYDDIKQALEGK